VTAIAEAPSAAAARARYQWVHMLFGVALALPLMVYAWIGAYSRYTADDFCWAGILRTQGFFDSQIHWYTQYSPRYAFSFLVDVTELIGPAIVPVLPATAIALSLSTLTWTLRQFGARGLRSVLLAEVAVLATLQTAPDLPQSLYWQTGLLTYLLPLILAAFLIGWIRRGFQKPLAYAVCFGVTFIAGGLAETYLIPQNVALTLSLVLALRYRHRRAHLAAALGGGVVALVVILASPSIGPRVQGTPADLWLATSAAIATAGIQVLRLARFFPFTVLLCLAAPALVGGGLPRISREWFVNVSVVTLITLPLCDFPSFYAQNGNPPMRSLIVPGAILVGYLFFVGLLFRDLTARFLAQPRHALAVAALALVPIGVALYSLPEQAAAASYATRFDAEEQQIRASRDAGQQDLTVPELPANFGEPFAGPDPTNFLNMCVARYYDVRSIATSGS